MCFLILFSKNYGFLTSVGQHEIVTYWSDLFCAEANPFMPNYAHLWPLFRNIPKVTYYAKRIGGVFYSGLVDSMKYNLKDRYVETS